jgi:hypothetical protein
MLGLILPLSLSVFDSVNPSAINYHVACTLVLHSIILINVLTRMKLAKPVSTKPLSVDVLILLLARSYLYTSTSYKGAT